MELETKTGHVQENNLTQYKERYSSGERTGCSGITEQAVPGSIQHRLLQGTGAKNQATD